MSATLEASPFKKYYKQYKYDTFLILECNFCFISEVFQTKTEPGDSSLTTLGNVNLQARCMLSDLVTDLQQIHYIPKQCHQCSSSNLRTSACLHE